MVRVDCVRGGGWVSCGRVSGAVQTSETPHNIRRRRLGIVAFHAYPLFNPGTRAPFGGSEVRTAMLARSLAQLGHWEVDLLVFDHNQPIDEKIDGVGLHALRGASPPNVPLAQPSRPWFSRAHLARYRDDGRLHLKLLWLALLALHRTYWPLQRLVVGPYERIYRMAGAVGAYGVPKSLVARLDEIDADAWTALPGGTLTAAQVAWYCRKRGKPFLFMAASDGDVDPRHRTRPRDPGRYGLPGYVHQYAIENAALLVVQNDEQAVVLRDGWGRIPRLLRNPVELVTDSPRADEDSVLWVGKSSSLKRPEYLQELVDALSSTRFTVVMNPIEEKRHASAKEQLAKNPRVTFVEYVPYDEIERLFSRASVLVNTSDFEGFPNTFLQAAKYGVPIVSLTADPNGMLSRHGAGYCCRGDRSELSRRVGELMTNATLRAAMGEKARSYVERYHSRSSVAAAFEEYLDGLVPRRHVADAETTIAEQRAPQ